MSQASRVALPAHPTSARRSSLLLVGALVVGTFGPYLFGGVRLEQLVVYGLALLVLPFSMLRFNPAGGMRFLIPWVVYIFVASLGILVPSALAAPYESGSVLAGYDNILAPLVTMLLVWSKVNDWEAESALRLLCKMVAVGMSLNGMVAIASTRFDLSEVLAVFWDSGDGRSVGQNAAALGRFSGVFNQPAEAGLLYGVAGLAAIYVWQSRPIFLMVLLSLISVGGLISVSKVFILGGLPLVLFYWFWSQRGGRKIFTLFGLFLAGLGFLESGLIDQWTGARYLARLFGGSESGGLALYTSGRYEEDSQFARVVADALDVSPLTGVGVAGWEVAYDGAIAETLVVAGVIGLCMYSFVLLGMFSLGFAQSGDLRVFTFLLTVATAGGAFGFSPLTANRTSTIVWLLIALIVLVNRAQRYSARRMPGSVSSSPAGMLE